MSPPQGIAHKQGVTNLNSYTYTYDALSRPTSVVSTAEGTSSYSYDTISQVTVATHTGQSNETYGFDANGNRNTTGYTVGTNNQTTAGLGFTFTYDFQGNRLTRTETSTGKVQSYEWDYRNRLTAVINRNTSGGAIVQRVDYEYDAYNRLVKRSLDADGVGVNPATTQYWAYDVGINAVLQFDGSASTNLSHRYLWSDRVDELFADEQITSDDDWIESGLGGVIGAQGPVVQAAAGQSIISNPLSKIGVGAGTGAISGAATGAIGGAIVDGPAGAIAGAGGGLVAGGISGGIGGALTNGDPIDAARNGSISGAVSGAISGPIAGMQVRGALVASTTTAATTEGQIVLKSGDSLIGWVKDGKIIGLSAPITSHSLLGTQLGVVIQGTAVKGSQAITIIKKGSEVTVVGSQNFGGIYSITDDVITLVQSIVK